MVEATPTAEAAETMTATFEPLVTKRHATMRDVAKAAGVSPTTVSSGTPPALRTIAATSSGAPWPKRSYRWGQIVA